jgi:hypothetical protein
LKRSSQHHYHLKTHRTSSTSAPLNQTSLQVASASTSAASSPSKICYH